MKNLAVSLLVGMAIAASAQAQSRELIQLQADVLRLSHQVSEIQSSLDERNAVVQQLVEQLVDRFATLSDAVGRIATTVEEVRGSNDTVSGEMRVLMQNLRNDVEVMDRNLEDLRIQVNTISQQVTSLGTTTSNLGSAGRLMSLAEADLFAGNYPLAVEGFREYLNRFPNGGDADRAQLNIGDAFFDQQEYEQAVLEYDLLLQKYPDSDRKVTALFKKGLALARMDDAGGAASLLEQVVADYPDSPEATRAREELERVGR